MPVKTRLLCVIQYIDDDKTFNALMVEIKRRRTLKEEKTHWIILFICHHPIQFGRTIISQCQSIHVWIESLIIISCVSFGEHLKLLQYLWGYYIKKLKHAYLNVIAYSNALKSKSTFLAQLKALRWIWINICWKCMRTTRAENSLTKFKRDFERGESEWMSNVEQLSLN